MQLLKALALTSLAGLAAAQAPNNTIVQNVQALNATVEGKDYSLSSALRLAGLVQPVVDALSAAGNTTLFAPTDRAFQSFGAANPSRLLDLSTNATLLQNALQYHTVAGSFLPAGQPAKQFVNTGYKNNFLRVDVAGDKVTLFFNGGNASVIDSIPSSNGIIHVVDHVLIAPPTAVEVAKKEGLDKLVESVVSSNLTSAVTDLNNATLFAPTDSAFNTVLSFAKDNGIDVNATTLQGILRFHVVPGTYFSTDIATVKTEQLATLLAGQNVTVTQDGANVKVVGAGQTALKLSPATVTKADVLVQGGVAHVIDAVLLPDLAAAAAHGNDTTGANAPSTKDSAASTVKASLAALAAVGAAVVYVL